MNKQQIKSILDNAPEGATHYENTGGDDSGYLECEDSSLSWRAYDSRYKRWIWIDSPLGAFYSIHSLDDLRTQLALIEENEKLKARVLTAENILYQLVEEQGLCCSEFGNLLPVEDQDSEVIRKAINFMNSHIQKFKELSND